MAEIPQKLDTLVPQMNVGVPAETQKDENLITDAALLGIYGEILSDIKKDREEIDNVLANFVDMVMNEGDTSTSTKEAVVNLLKVKADQADKATKVADLMTRLKLKDKDTFPRYLAAQQHNTINIGDSGQKRALLDALNKAKKEKKDDPTQS